MGCVTWFSIDAWDMNVLLKNGLSWDYLWYRVFIISVANKWIHEEGNMFKRPCPLLKNQVDPILYK